MLLVKDKVKQDCFLNLRESRGPLNFCIHGGSSVFDETMAMWRVDDAGRKSTLDNLLKKKIGQRIHNRWAASIHLS